jgi:hypothetical protein
MEHSDELVGKILWLFLHGERGKPIIITNEEQLEEAVNKTKENSND